ncbi:chymotrypsin-2-like [Anopheles marshallii]|uniref:chymotrypsin-2-like n=1 Tax=Anopheles marshallii TaxID=1521116 RepID=UPI00237A7FA3|nr:chymotrypsin-2-like [Anopheles marshallii]
MQMSIIFYDLMTSLYMKAFIISELSTVRMGRSVRVLLRATLLCIYIASLEAHRYERMASGTDVEQWEVPYQVSFRLIEADRHLGSGAILNVRYIITQASFIWKLLRTYPEQSLSALARIRLGQVELKSKADDQFRSIYSYTYHPSFDFEAARNDIALVRTVEYIEFNRFVQPIELRKGSIPEGSAVMYTDWGAERDTATQDDYKEKLQKVDARAISNDQCKELLSPWDLQDLVYDTRVCIYTNGTGSICTGNVGGPLVIMEVGQPQLVGVMSYVYRACNSYAPGGFERLWNHYEWVTKTVTIDYSYVNFGEMCRVARNVAAQLLFQNKETVRQRRALKNSQSENDTKL